MRTCFGARFIWITSSVKHQLCVGRAAKLVEQQGIADARLGAGEILGHRLELVQRLLGAAGAGKRAGIQQMAFGEFEIRPAVAHGLERGDASRQTGSGRIRPCALPMRIDRLVARLLLQDVLVVLRAPRRTSRPPCTRRRARHGLRPCPPSAAGPTAAGTAFPDRACWRCGGGLRVPRARPAVRGSARSKYRQARRCPAPSG